MSKLTIKDLETSRELDREAASAILGGINEWIHIPTPSIPFRPMSMTNIYNIDNDYTMINPQIFNVGNGVTNSGSIVYNVSPMLLNAGSPINVLS
jgi:hypothetical protein